MKLVMAAVAVAALASPALADDWDFILINNATKEIKTIELAATGTTEWQPNKIDPEMKREATVKNGARTTVHFDKGDGCKYDVRITFTDDSQSTWSKVDVCDNSFVTVRYNASGVPVFTAN